MKLPYCVVLGTSSYSSPVILWCFVIASSRAAASSIKLPASPASPLPSSLQSAWSQHGYVMTCKSISPRLNVPFSSLDCTSLWCPSILPCGLLSSHSVAILAPLSDSVSSVPPTTDHPGVRRTVDSRKPS